MVSKKTNHPQPIDTAIAVLDAAIERQYGAQDFEKELRQEAAQITQAAAALLLAFGQGDPRWAHKYGIAAQAKDLMQTVDGAVTAWCEANTSAATREKKARKALKTAREWLAGLAHIAKGEE